MKTAPASCARAELPRGAHTRARRPSAFALSSSGNRPTAYIAHLCFGGAPANFLDAGGGSKAEAITSAVEVILSNPNVTAVLFNIFGGITRCDEVAKGLIEAFEQIDPLDRDAAAGPSGQLAPAAGPGAQRIDPRGQVGGLVLQEQPEEPQLGPSPEPKEGRIRLSLLKAATQGVQAQQRDRKARHDQQERRREVELLGHPGADEHTHRQAAEQRRDLHGGHSPDPAAPDLARPLSAQSGSSGNTAPCRTIVP